MGEKKNMKIEIRQTDDGGLIASFKTGFRKNEKYVAESVDTLLQKVSDKISKYYKGYGAS